MSQSARPPSRRQRWNERYRSTDLVWGVEPNRLLVAALEDADLDEPIVDLACGEGRNAIWLASRGRRVTGVDFSDVAIERAQELASERGVEVEFVCEDVTAWEAEPGAYRGAIILYLQLPGGDRRRALTRAAAALAPGGELLMIGHARENLERGVGGPQDPEVLWDPAQLKSELEALGLVVSRAEHQLRPVEGEGDAIDTLLRARRRDGRPGPPRA
jgi:SAM-dependent methyltransferase